MQWTRAQRQAIEARGENLLVTAAAGSGKTAVLAERILSLAREGVRIDAMLVVTFTRAAAAEMRARILKRLYEEGMAEQALRVERARLLLTGTAAPITQICYECGFENQRTFNRAFLAACGTTPTRYRETGGR